MVPVLDQVHAHIRPRHRLGDAQRVLPGHVRVLLALQDAHRHLQRQRAAQQQVAPPILDQRTGDGVGRAVFARAVPHAVALDRFAHLGRELRPHQVLGEVGGGGDADQGARLDAAARGQQQRDPAAHRGTDQHLRAVRLRGDHAGGVLRPAADGAVLEAAARTAVTRIVEAQEGRAARLAPAGEEFRLAARHVAVEATQEDNARAAARRASPGEADAVAAVEGAEVFLHVVQSPGEGSALRIPHPPKAERPLETMTRVRGAGGRAASGMRTGRPCRRSRAGIRRCGPPRSPACRGAGWKCAPRRLRGG